MKRSVSLAIKTEILRELMKDKVFVQKMDKAKKFHEIIEVVREFAEKKGYKFAEIYVNNQQKNVQ